MGKLFPSMCSKPEKIKIFALIPCWLWVFVLLPMYLPFVGLGIWEQWEISAWLDIAYHVLNGLTMLFLMRSYLKDEWDMVTTDVLYYLKYALLTVGLMVAVELALLGALHHCGFFIGYMLNGLPVAEFFVSHTTLSLISFEPVFGTIALTVFAPISICALFYCLGFAPVCYRKPWLAYLCIVIITLIPPIINILWRGQEMQTLSIYLVQLPIHLLACWSYQKTDNVWTPIASLAITNLLASIALNFLYI